MTKLLIVDDEKSTAFGLKGVLKKPGLHILTANTLEEAKSLLLDEKIDVLLSDIRLSGSLATEGIELLGFSKERGLSTGVILMTAYGDPQTMQKAFDLGADFYLEKPVELTLLANIIEQAAGGYSEHREPS